MEQFWCFSQGGINQEEDKLWQMHAKYSKDKMGIKIVKLNVIQTIQYQFFF